LEQDFSRQRQKGHEENFEQEVTEETEKTMGVFDFSVTSVSSCSIIFAFLGVFDFGELSRAVPWW
jgi:hypothetical protein